MNKQFLQGGISTIPLKTPCPDLTHKGTITVSKSPSLKYKHSAPNNNSQSSDLLIDEIGRLRRQNINLKQQISRYRSSNRYNKTLPSHFPQIPQQQNQISPKIRKSKLNQKDVLIQKLKQDIKQLQKVLANDSDKVYKLQKQNQTLKNVISLNIDFNQQDDLKKSNIKLQQRFKQLEKYNEKLIQQNQSLKVKINESLTQKVQKYNQQSIKRIIDKDIAQQIQEMIYKQFSVISDKCLSLSSRIQQIQIQIQDTKQITKHHSLKNSKENNKIKDKQSTSTQTVQQSQKLVQSIAPTQPASQSDPSISVPLQQYNKMTKLITTYQTQLNKKDSVINSLQLKLSSSNQKILTVQYQLRNVKQSPYLLQSKQMLDLRRQIQQLKRIIELSRNPITPMLEQLKSKDKLISQLQQEINHLKQIIQQLQKQIYLLKNNKSQSIQFIKQVQEIKQQFKQVLAQKSKSDTMIDKQNIKISELKKQIENHIVNNQNLIKQLAQFEKLKHNQNNNKITQQTINKLNNTIKQLQNQNQTVEHEIERNKVILNKVQVQLQDKQTQISQLKNKQKNNQNNKQWLQKEIKSKDQYLIQLLQQIEHVKTVLKKIDFTKLQTCLRKLSNAKKHQLQRIVTKVSQLEKQILMTNQYKINAMKLTGLNTQLQYSKKMAIDALQQQKLLNSQLQKQVSELKNTISYYLNNKPVENNQLDRTPKKTLTISNFKYNLSKQQTVKMKQSVDLINQKVSNTQVHIFNALQKSNKK